jgi:hypothetical protein
MSEPQGSNREFVWLDPSNGVVLTPDAMEELISTNRARLIGRTSSQVVLAGEGGDQVFVRTSGDLIII